MTKPPSVTQAYTAKSGVAYILEYHDADSFADLDYDKCRQVYGVCFCGDKLVVGFGGQKQGWGLIGGTVEDGETFERTLAREIREESNMKVISWLPIGYQKVVDTRDESYVYQLRYACAVETFGPFVADPAGGVIEIRLIDPGDYRKYFDWGEIGERIIARALELKGQFSKTAN